MPGRLQGRAGRAISRSDHAGCNWPASGERRWCGDPLACRGRVGLRRRAVVSGYVFISYAREQRPYVAHLCDYLRGVRVPAWYDDSIETGQRFPDEIEARIRNCAALILVMTPQSATSDWVRQELRWAESFR